MTMSVTQVRLPEGLERGLDALVERGLYASKSDAVRDAVRRMLLEKQISSVPNTGNSVREIRAIRKKLSKEKISLDEINSLGK